MKFFDTHLHLPSPDGQGLDLLNAHVRGQPDMVGGLLILNTREEVDFAAAHVRDLPQNLTPVPYFWPRRPTPASLTSGWWKIHSVLGGIDDATVPAVVEAVRTADSPIRGLIVHCYPWGPKLHLQTGLKLVVALAQALPDLPILAAHGGGYASWALHAHTAGLSNVHYDFSVSLSWYRGSDVLRPLVEQLRWRPTRVLFGSDWPSARCGPQIEETVRLASEAGLSPRELEALLLTNSRRLWPETVSVLCSSGGT